MRLRRLTVGERHSMVQERWKKTIEAAALNFKERRSNGRCFFVARAELVDLNSNSRLASRTADIDRGGCYIDTLNPLPVGTPVTLRVTKGNQSFKADAEVVYVQNANGMGLTFTATQAEELRILDLWMAGLDTVMASNTPKSEPPEPHERATTPFQSQRPAGRSEHERGESLTYLILMLIQKNVLSEMEGKALLEKLGA